MKRCDKLAKTIQRRVYDFLLTRYGVSLLCFGALLIVVCLIQLSDTILEYRISEFKQLADIVQLKRTTSASKIARTIADNPSPLSDNFEAVEQPLSTSIDVVYTWVNGSDPAHLSLIKKYKLDSGDDTQLNSSQTKFATVEFSQFYEKLMHINSSSANDTTKNEQQYDDDSHWPCYHKLCMQTNNLIVILPQLKQMDKQSFLYTAKITFEADLFSNISIDHVNKVYHDSSERNSNNFLAHQSSLSILYINNFDFKTNLTVLKQMNELFSKELLAKNYQLFMGYYTIDCELAVNCVKDLNRSFIIKKLKSTISEENLHVVANNGFLDNIGNSELRSRLSYSLNPAPPIYAGNLAAANDDSTALELPKNIEDNLFYKFDYIHSPAQVYDGSASTTTPSSSKYSTSSSKKKVKSSKHATHLSVFKVKSRETSNYLSNLVSNQSQALSFKGKIGNRITYDLYRANVVWDLGDPLVEDVAANRFQDNDELKYSLRSVEKYAPWIRNVYIVTNGQKPHWLNISHPRIKLVTHEQIFPNRSHLPTFSSPAIETHLHQIAGLGARFLYFNDDVLLGAPVWPDDFVTRSKGFRLRLAWSLPGCNVRCPQSWINDGYCDRACNTADCDFDGGDCDSQRLANRSTRIGQLQQNARNNMFMNQSSQLYCSPACANSWLADKYCDKACNTRNCAFDMGDCGVESLRNELYHVNLFNPGDSLEEIIKIVKTFRLPLNLMHFYINFTASFTLRNTTLNFRVNKATYEENKLVRSVSAVNKFGTLVVLLTSSNYTGYSQSNDSKSSQIKIYLDCGFSEEGSTVTKHQVNVTLTMLLNSFNRDNQTDPNLAPTFGNPEHRTTTLPLKLIIVRTVEPRDASPKVNSIPNFVNNDELMKPKFTNRLFQNLYDNYHEYLMWSQQNGYLTDTGLKYKLRLLAEKIKTEMNQTFSKLAEKVDLNADLWSSRDNSVLNLFYDFIFRTNNGVFFNEFDKTDLIDQFLNTTASNENSLFVQFKKRKLLDTFADSLRHVNRLFNQIYGYMARKVPAHIPHFIDRHIMGKLQQKFKSEFERTSANRFRSSTDMQYAFSYDYFLMSELEEFNATKLFDEEIDLNSNGLLDPSEIMFVNLKVASRSFSLTGGSYGNEAPASELFTLNVDLGISLAECRSNQSVSNNSLINKSQFLACQSLVQFLKENLWFSSSNDKVSHDRYKYKFEVAGDEETKFVMISDDPMEIQVKLANLIREPRKFICLNDNIDYQLRTEATQLKAIIRNYFTTLFPLKSSFELSEVTPSQLEYSSPFFLSLNNDVLASSNRLNTLTSGAGSQRMFFFLPILVAVFILCFYLVKKLVLKDDEASLMERGRGVRSFGSRFGLMRRTPAKTANSPHSFATKKLDSSGSKKHRVSNALRRKMEEADFSSDSDNLSKLSDEDSTHSTSSSANRSHLSSTVNNETGMKVYGVPREGLTRKKKSSATKKLNITTI